MVKKKHEIPNNILLHLEGKTREYDSRTALGIKNSFGWKDFSYRGIGLMSRKLACYLMNNLELEKGERVAIFSESRPEYAAGIFAGVLAGAVLVPLDIKLTKYELISILSDCKPTVILTSQSHLQMVLELKDELDSLKHIILLDEPVCGMTLPCLYTLPNNYENKWCRRSPQSTALIIYTSGTTGSPKGVEISFRNILAQLEAMGDIYKYLFKPHEHVNVLSILPMNHLFELTVGFSVFLTWGMSVYYMQSLKPKDILSSMKDKKINFMIVVPAFLKLLKAGVEAELKNQPKYVQTIFSFMYKLAKYVPFIGIRKIMFKRIHDKFGGNFKGCISGGAALDVNVGEFFERIGIRVYQGYGLTEMSPVVSVNYNKRGDLASIGQPLKNVEAKLDSQTNELLLRGPSVMKGYYNNPELTAQVIDSEGWFHTGDVGKIGKDGHMYITGRIKNMIVLNGGKKVFPEEVEAVLESSEFFAECCVFGYSRTTGAKEGT